MASAPALYAENICNLSVALTNNIEKFPSTNNNRTKIMLQGKVREHLMVRFIYFSWCHRSWHVKNFTSSKPVQNILENKHQF
jgi:hypothetical protein